jgi:hypothetical protein
MRENRKYGLMRENRTLFYGIPKRARSWKRRLRPRDNLKNDMPVLYSTRFLFLTHDDLLLCRSAIFFSLAVVLSQDLKNKNGVK